MTVSIYLSHYVCNQLCVAEESCVENEIRRRRQYVNEEKEEAVKRKKREKLISMKRKPVCERRRERREREEEVEKRERGKACEMKIPLWSLSICLRESYQRNERRGRRKMKKLKKAKKKTPALRRKLHRLICSSKRRNAIQKLVKPKKSASYHQPRKWLSWNENIEES